MSNIDKQALLRAAVKVGAHTWEAEGSQVWSMSNGTADSFVLEVFGDETSGQQDCDIASFIAAANPATVLALLDELAAKDSELQELRKADSRTNVRREHVEWSQATFGNVGPIGPLKHLSKEALEAAADPSDPLEWADMQFLLWDAQRRMGISDEFITRAMVEKLAINKARQWPEPKDGEPRLHIKPEPTPEITAGFKLVPTLPTQEMAVAGGDTYVRCEEVNQYPTDAARRIWAAMVAAAPLQEAKKTTVAKEIATGARLTDHRFKI